MTRLVLGLDIGVTSVGYGVIDIDSNEFVDYGVRLFKEGTAENNEKRRTVRGRRRLLSRKNTRLQDMQKLLKNNGIMGDDYHPLQNVYEVRVKGLTEKLSNDELTAAILHLTKHRGSSLDTVDDNDSDDDGEGTKDILARNNKELSKGKYVCEVQLERLQDKSKVRGHDNNFRTEDYVNEAEKILSNQGLDEALNNQILQIIQRKRAYYEGPGSEKSPTPYGRFFYNENGEIQYEDLIERMRGRCSVFPDEFRAPKMAVTAELFNVLNDLNNLKVNGESLETEQKKEILSIISKTGSITPKKIASLLNADLEDISGFRIDKNDKPLITEFKGYKEMKKSFKNHGMDITLNDYEMMDSIIEILTNKKGLDERKEAIHKLGYELSAELVEEISSKTKIVGYHALSLKAMHLLNEELYKTSMNQMQLLHELKLFDKNRASHKGKKNIEADDTAILSPVAKKAQRETFKIVNTLRKRYGEFDSIVVEMTRAKNSKEQKDNIKKKQKAFETRNKEVDTFLKDAGFEPDKVNGKTKQKIRLYMEQECKSAYTFQDLDLRRIISDPSYVEIDHIIPISISLDDSQNNKVLITRMENQLKGNLTPIMAYKAGKFDGLGCSLNEYRERSNKNKNFKKKRNLLFEEDITKFSVIKEFINRNLVDTSYACRVVLNKLSDYFKDNEIDTKVHTVKGSITHKFRNQIQLEKEREEDYLHHAIDGLIVASVKKMNLLNTYLSKYTFDNFYDETTGEIKAIPDDNAYLDPLYISFIARLKGIYEDSNKYYKGQIEKEDLYYNPIKISHKVDTKPNRQIADETLYSTRTTENGEMLVERIKDIYAQKDKQVIKMVSDIINGESSLIMKDKDPQTFAILEQIVMADFEMYKDSKEHYEKDKKGKYILVGDNPLIAYREQFGPLRKYSKKGNGPEIKTIKFYSEKLGNHLDVTSNYNTTKKKVIMKQISPYRTDFYQCSDGKFRFVTVRYKDVHYEKNKDKYVIDENWYKSELERKKIDTKARFVCSCHRDELIGIVKKPGDKYIYDQSKENDGPILYHDGIHPEVVKFTATNNDNTGTIEVKPIYTHCKKQLMPTVTSFVNIIKYSTDVLGNLYEVKENNLKLVFD